MCKHENFHCNVDINRVGEGDLPIGEVKGFLAEITIRCTDCNTPFEFIGLECGLMWDKPMTNPSAQIARMPIKPKGLEILPGLPGFKVKAN